MSLANNILQQVGLLFFVCLHANLLLSLIKVTVRRCQYILWVFMCLRQSVYLDNFVIFEVCLPLSLPCVECLKKEFIVQYMCFYHNYFHVSIIANLNNIAL